MGQRKKQEVEERRVKQKKAREDFIKMLEVCFLLGLKFLLVFVIIIVVFFWDTLNYFIYLYYLLFFVLDFMQESIDLTSSIRWRFVSSAMVAIFSNFLPTEMVFRLCLVLVSPVIITLC